MCFFRCLAINKNFPTTSLEKKTKELLRKWVSHTKVSFKPFQGIHPEEINCAEKLFQVNIMIYELVSEHKKSLSLKRRSETNFDCTMNLLQYGNHFCYIKDVDKASSSFFCRYCKKLFLKPNTFLKHTTHKCKGNKIQFHFPGGYFNLKKNIIEELKEVCNIKLHDRFSPFQVVFDFECYFTKENLPTTSSEKSLKFEYVHIPASVSVSSNIPNYCTPKCFVSNGDSQQLIDEFVEYLIELSDQSYEILLQRNKHAFKKIDKCIKSVKKNIETTETWIEKDCLLKLKTLKFKLDRFLRELTIVSFNGGRYDINLIKNYLFCSLLKHGQECTTQSNEEEEEEEEEKEENIYK